MRYKIVIKDYSLYLLGKFFPGIGNLLFVILFNNLIGSIEYGKYSTVSSIVIVLVSLSTTWINQSLLRFYTFYDVEKQAIFKNISFIITIIMLLSTVMLTSIVVYIYRIYEVKNVLTTLFNGYLETFSFVFFAITMGMYFLKIVLYQVQLNPHQIMKIEFLRTLAGLIIPLSLIVVFKQKTSILLIFGLSLSYLLMLNDISQLYVFISDFKKELNKYLKTIYEILSEGWKYGWPLSIWLAATQSFPLMEKFWILSKYDMNVVGIYSSTYELITRFYSFALYPIFMSVNARIMYSWNNNNYKEAKNLIAIAVIAEIVISTLSIFLVLLNKDFLVEVIASKLGYTSQIAIKTIDSTILQFFITGALWQIVIVVQKPMEMRKMTKTMMLSALASILFHYLFNLFVSKNIQYIGLSSVLSPLVYLCICFVFYLSSNKSERRIERV